MIKKRMLTALLMMVAALFVCGNAVRTALLPHVKAELVSSGSITYDFSGWQFIQTEEGLFQLTVEKDYASCFVQGTQVRWMPYSETIQPQMLQVTALETMDTDCIVTLHPFWESGSVMIEDGSVQVDSPFYPALVPRTAFVSEDMVYVLQQDYSTGSKDDIVAACRVETAPGNDQYIPCVSGIASGTWVLTAWDRPLTMGGKVTIVSTTGIN